MKLKIYNYEILNFDAASAIISEKGVARIDSPSMLKLLTELKSTKNITHDDLNALFIDHELDPATAYDFLNTSIRISEEKATRYFTNAIIIHDWAEAFTLERILSSEIAGIRLHHLNDAWELTNNSYVIILCAKYNHEKIKSTYFTIAKKWPRIAISVCYGNGDLFHISQPYIPEIGNPCHFCTTDKLISNEMHSSSSNTWSKLLDFCRSKNIDLPAIKPILLQESLLLGAIARTIRLVMGSTESRKYQDNILQGTSINLVNGNVNQISATHWHLCDCLSVTE